MECEKALRDGGSRGEDGDNIISWDSSRDSWNRAIVLGVPFKFNGEIAENDIISKAPGGNV